LGRILSGGGRPAWYDRNPESESDYWVGLDIGPHVLTDRIAYTVPSGKRAMIELLQLTVHRRAAATTAGYVRAIASTYTQIQGTREIVHASIFYSNTVDIRDDKCFGLGFVLKTGEMISFRTGDGSTGGTCDWVLTYKLTKYDA